MKKEKSWSLSAVRAVSFSVAMSKKGELFNSGSCSNQRDLVCWVLIQQYLSSIHHSTASQLAEMRWHYNRELIKLNTRWEDTFSFQYPMIPERMWATWVGAEMLEGDPVRHRCIHCLVEMNWSTAVTWLLSSQPTQYLSTGSHQHLSAACQSIMTLIGIMLLKRGAKLNLVVIEHVFGIGVLWGLEVRWRNVRRWVQWWWGMHSKVKLERGARWWLSNETTQQRALREEHWYIYI